MMSLFRKRAVTFEEAVVQAVRSGDITEDVARRLLNLPSPNAYKHRHNFKFLKRLDIDPGIFIFMCMGCYHVYARRLWG